MIFGGRGTHNDWIDDIFFDSNNNTFYRKINKKKNSGTYTYVDKTLTLFWDHWGTETLETNDEIIFENSHLIIRLNNQIVNTKSNTEMKLIINTHIRYTTPLKHLFSSINKHCPSIYNQTILIINDCDEESIEKNVYLNANNEMMIVRTCDNVYEYTSNTVIDKYQNDDRINANYYLCIHDTCEVGSKFLSKFNFYKKKINATWNKMNVQIIKPKNVSSNICIFRKDIMIKFAPLVSLITSKRIAVDFEHGYHQNSIYNMSDKTLYLSNRKVIGKKDVYNTSIQRITFYYPDFDLNKYILIGFEGDIVNNVVPIIYENKLI